MATSYLAPGLYIEEAPTGVRTIEAVGTSTPAFIGEAPNPDARVGVAEAINDWEQFKRKFVSNGSASTMLSHAVFGFYNNCGRGRCYVVNIGKQTVETALDQLERIDDIAIVAAPGYTDFPSQDALLNHCQKMNRFAILDAPREVKNIASLTQTGSVSEPAGAARAGKPADGDATERAAEAADDAGVGPPDSTFGAFYFPWITVQDALNTKLRVIVAVPPSGHLAGIYARTDARRGVHKAPANERINGAYDVTYRVTDSEQEVLNPAGVNCIRFFTREGVCVWGARTVAKTSIEWRYVNVRRTYQWISKSIRGGTKWVVFEPNDPSLWKNIRSNVEQFLLQAWRGGALFGTSPEQAFFVKCDAETNPPEEIESGRVIAVIGIAPVRPAEFVLFRIGQGVGGAEIETVS
ncbi:phage tail protein [Caballeronia megalochromosomata]|jgi:uncharacterized protein|nr:phage tail protein [Caballeronia megalochromosomata]